MLIFYYLPCFRCWKKAADLGKIFRIGRRKIDNELNIVNLVKNMNIIKIFMKNSIVTEKILWEVYHCKKNIINIENDSCNEFSSSDEDPDEKDFSPLSATNKNLVHHRHNSFTSK